MAESLQFSQVETRLEQNGVGSGLQARGEARQAATEGGHLQSVGGLSCFVIFYNILKPCTGEN